MRPGQHGWHLPPGGARPHASPRSAEDAPGFGDTDLTGHLGPEDFTVQGGKKTELMSLWRGEGSVQKKAGRDSTACEPRETQAGLLVTGCRFNYRGLCLG